MGSLASTLYRRCWVLSGRLLVPARPLGCCSSAEARSRYVCPLCPEPLGILGRYTATVSPAGTLPGPGLRQLPVRAHGSHVSDPWSLFELSLSSAGARHLEYSPGNGTLHAVTGSVVQVTCHTCSSLRLRAQKNRFHKREKGQRPSRGRGEGMAGPTPGSRPGAGLEGRRASKAQAQGRGAGGEESMVPGWAAGATPLRGTEAR